MKKTILTVGVFTLLCLSLAACKTNDSSSPDNTVPAPSASQLPNVSAEPSGARPENGQVTDGNGIIGDDDDLIYPNEKNDNTPGEMLDNAANNTGDFIDNAADNIGNTASNITSNAGNVVSNITSNIGDSISNIADNAGDTVENAADNIGDTAENSR